MYTEHFDLSRPLFQDGLARDGQVFTNARLNMLQANLTIALTRRDSAAVIYGQAGTGKTTTALHTMRSMATQLALGAITHTPLSAHELLEQLLTEFGFSPYKNSRTERLQIWRQFLHEMGVTNTRVCIVVENAQDLTVEVLEALNSLTSADASGSAGANVLLTMRGPSDALLTAPRIAPFRQRIRLQTTVAPLSAAETLEYLEFKVSAAGGRFGQIFAADAGQAIHAYSGGVIRLIDNIVESCLSIGALRKEQQISAALVSRVAVGLFGIPQAAAQPASTGVPEVEPQEAAAQPGKPGAAATDDPADEPEGRSNIAAEKPRAGSQAGAGPESSARTPAAKTPSAREAGAAALSSAQERPAEAAAKADQAVSMQPEDTGPSAAERAEKVTGAESAGISEPGAAAPIGRAGGSQSAQGRPAPNGHAAAKKTPPTDTATPTGQQAADESPEPRRAAARADAAVSDEPVDAKGSRAMAAAAESPRPAENRPEKERESLGRHAPAGDEPPELDADDLEAMLAAAIDTSSKAETATDDPPASRRASRGAKDAEEAVPVLMDTIEDNGTIDLDATDASMIQPMPGLEDILDPSSFTFDTEADGDETDSADGEDEAISEEDRAQIELLEAFATAEALEDISNSMAETLFGDLELDQLAAALAVEKGSDQEAETDGSGDPAARRRVAEGSGRR